ncbi:hypothetical protein ACFLTP_06475 [Chloroflexota bacterium]
MNHQPWLFIVRSNSITLSVNRRGQEFGLSKRLHCGIAILHMK